MKTFNSLGMALIMSMFCLSLNSCGGDDDGNPGNETTNGGSETPEDNLPEASKTFVGYWLDSYSGTTFRYSNWIFYENGICQQNYYYMGSLSESTKGYWTYNPKTSLLATTVNAWQWQITISNNESWAGITPNKHSFSLNKAANYRYFQDCLEYHKWETETNKIVENVSSLLESSYPGYLNIEEDENTEDFIFKYTFKDFNRVYDTGTITVTNPYHSTKCQLTIKGNIKQTLTIYNE